VRFGCIDMHIQAQVALQAVNIYKMCGMYAAIRYAEKRGCPQKLFITALRLEYPYQTIFND